MVAPVSVGNGGNRLGPKLPPTLRRPQLGVHGTGSLVTWHGPVGADAHEPAGTDHGSPDEQAWRQVEERIKTINERRRAVDRSLGRNRGGIGR
jgi:hypothetical protein